MPSLTVIIINWNGEGILKPCLNSIFQNSVTPEEIIVVDNASSDASLDILSSYSDVKVVKSEVNKGFSGGFNLGFSEITSDYCLLLNNDTELAPDCIANVKQGIAENPEAGMFALQIRLNEKELDSLGIGIAFDGMSKQCAHKISVDDVDKAIKREALPSGCAAVYNLEMLRQIGLYDESFFAYCEDTDLALRGVNHGWKSYLIDKAIVYHLHSHSHGKFSSDKVYFVERNHFFVAIKNFPLSLILLLPLTTLCRWFFQAVSLFTSSTMRNFAANSEGNVIVAILKAYCDALKKAPFYWSKRKEMIRNNNEITKTSLDNVRKYKITFPSLFR